MRSKHSPCYSPELAEYIVEQLSAGRSLSSICKERKAELGLPVGRTAVLWWVQNDTQGFQEKYDRARMLAGDSFVDQVVEISERLDKVDTKVPGSLNEVKRLEAKAKSLQWAAEKSNPHKYGQRPAELLLAEPSSPEEVSRRLALLLGLKPPIEGEAKRIGPA